MTTPAEPVQGKRKGKISPTVVIVGLVVALAGGAYLLYRQRKNAAASTAASAPADTSTSEDVAGQIGTLQSEIGNLQSSAAQDEAGEAGTGTAPAPGGTPAALTAPGGFSVTPHPGYADFGWGKVAGAKAYELVITGAGGKGTGTSHYDHAGADNHAEHVQLTPGAYRARVRAGTSTAALTGPWTPYKSFTVPKATAARPRPGTEVPAGKG